MRVKRAEDALIEAERLKAEKLAKKKKNKRKGGTLKLKNKKKKAAIETDNGDLKT